MFLDGTLVRNFWSHVTRGTDRQSAQRTGSLGYEFAPCFFPFYAIEISELGNGGGMRTEQLAVSQAARKPHYRRHFVEEV